ncbi:hypothetical protein AAF712_000403 [Marasmius tenuissimus]|uniref:Uncharacterized protein n=1 Tax=Marasmius tenuissimus TaxID=585030 RepID=A0ABR3AGP3_9AGAR
MHFSSFLTLVTLSTLAFGATVSHVEKRKDVDRPNPAGLEHCPGNSPGDADKCTYEMKETGPDSIITQIVGDPVNNCKGGTTDLKTTIGGDRSVSQTWKYGVSAGFSADGGEKLPVGVSFESSDSWSNTETKTFRQNIEVTFKPEQKASVIQLISPTSGTNASLQAALIAKITAKTYVGRVRINYGDPQERKGRTTTTTSGTRMALGAFNPPTKSFTIRGL